MSNREHHEDRELSRHEFALIDRIRRQVTRQHDQTQRGIPMGIGDDAALLAVGGANSNLLVTTDVLMEGVHFDLSVASPSAVGRKALAVNLSDIAAMAGRPTAAFVGLVLPRSLGAAFGDELMSGLMVMADEFDVTLAGGDTNIWDGPAVISVTLLGEPTGDRVLTRAGAKVGDWLMVTGRLGGSLSDDHAGRHLTFTPRVAEAIALNTTVDIHAMIDLSDGLASDVHHILTESRVGAIIDPQTIPVHPDVDLSLTPDVRLSHAFSDGEDFELLFTTTPATGQRLLDRPLFETPLTHVGSIVDHSDKQGCWLEVGPLIWTKLEPTGWQHVFGDETV